MTAPIPTTDDRTWLRWLIQQLGATRFTVQDIDRATYPAGRTHAPRPEDMREYHRMLAALTDGGFLATAPGPRGGAGWVVTDTGRMAVGAPLAPPPPCAHPTATHPHGPIP